MYRNGRLPNMTGTYCYLFFGEYESRTPNKTKTTGSNSQLLIGSSLLGNIFWPILLYFILRVAI
jgi:hypothetical protein